MVFANPRLWSPALVLNAQPAGSVAGRLPAADLQRPVEHHPAATPARTRAYKLRGCLAGAVFLLAGALTSMFDY